MGGNFDMNEVVLTLIVNGIATPILVLVTMWVKQALSSNEKRERRSDAIEDEYRKETTARIDSLEREIRELRMELKNRDAEYIELYKQYTTLKAKHEVLETDYNQTVKELHATQKELSALKEDIKTRASLVAGEMQKL